MGGRDVQYHLDPEQRRRVEQVARERGIACPRCGSATDLSSGRMVLGELGPGNVEVELWCNKHPGEAMQALTLSPGEAGQIGIVLYP